jgi:MFS family permease
MEPGTGRLAKMGRDTDVRESRGPSLQEPAAESDRIGTFHAFRFPNYRLLWLGNAFTSAAMWIQQTTIGWVVYDLTGSGSLLGAVNSCRTLPSFFIAPLSGVTADRFSRNRIIAVSQASLFVVTFLLALSLATHVAGVGHLFAFALLTGVANAFNMPARQTLVFDLVPREVIPNAVALSNMAFSTMRTVGPMLGGALIVLFGPANNFFVQSCMYLAVMTTVLLLRVPPRRQPNGRRSVFREMLEGYGFIARTPQARLLMLMSVIPPTLLIPIHQTILPIYAKDILDAGASGLGLILAAIGFGGIFGGLLTASLNHVDRRGLLQLGALLVLGLSEAAFCVVGALTGSLWLAVGFMALAGAGESLYNTTNQTVLQLLAPDEMRGRISSALQIQPIFMSIGAITMGTAADRLGAPLVGTTAALAAAILGALILAGSSRMRRLRLSQLRA